MQLSARARGFESLTLRHETFSKNHAVSVFLGIAWFFLFCPEQCSACKSSKTAGFYAVLQENATRNATRKSGGTERRISSGYRRFFIFLYRIFRKKLSMRSSTFSRSSLNVCWYTFWSVPLDDQPPRSMAYLSGTPKATMIEAFICLKS